jgi:hypothetical protein
MDFGLRLRRLAIVFIASMGILSLAAYPSSPSPTAPPINTTSTSVDILPRNVVVPLDVVREHFPEVNQEASTGPNPTAVGNPTATRSVVYATADDSAKVTITVDQYRSPNDAAFAYREAVQKSQGAPGFKLLSLSNVGQQSFAGTAAVAMEMHIGLGALDGNLIVGVTLAGYNASPETQAKLVVLSGIEDAAAKAALAASEHR